jgi:Mor family transcriptional regulator
MARPRGTGVLAEWEVAEMAHYARCGWSLFELASHYGLSERTVQRILRRMPQEPLRADSSAAEDENE